MTQPLLKGAARWGLPAIIVLYLVMATLYAVYTPAWQAPDEPAHYNYIRTLAEQHRFPILKLGDYPAAYLEEIKAAHFPAGMSIDPIRYEFHQPPLYYLLAVPVYQLFAGALLPLRLLSVAMGAVLLAIVCWAMQELTPDRPFLGLGVTAFIAFLPMHLAFTAAVNNDTLAEILLTTVLLLAIRYLKRSAVVAADATATPLDRARMGSLEVDEDTRLLVLLGITTGLGLVTKTSVYVALPLALLAIAARHLWLEREGPPASTTFKAAASFLVPAIGFAIPWWVRNMAVYGGLDFLGLGRHAEVVVGQLRTSEFISAHGAGQLIHDFFLTSFHSFWGQFGWMGVVLDQRIYQALAILSAVAVAGFLAWVIRLWRTRTAGHSAAAWQWAACGLLAVSGLFTVASYLWYNTQFVQHQGRYLFPALLPIGLAVAIGWREALRHRYSLLMATLAVVSIGIVWLAEYELGEPTETWLLAMLGGTAAAFVVRGFLPRRYDPLVQVCPYLLLIPLDAICLFMFVVPQLAA